MGPSEPVSPAASARPPRWRTALGIVLALGTVGALVGTGLAEDDGEQTAIQQALGDQQLRIMAPANPGGGWDQTSRAVQTSLADIVGRSEVYNVGGAGGTIGLSQFVRHSGEPSELIVTGAIMMGAILTNGSAADLQDVDMLARLSTEYLVVVVPADSELETMEDLADAMREDIGAVSISGGSAGGVEQILAGLIAAAVGAEPRDVSYVAHSGGGEALTTLLSGRSTAGISGISEIAPYIADGSVRALAVSSPEPLDSVEGVPTLRETGVDVELQNWRGIAAPSGITDEQHEALVGMLEEMRDSDAWQEILETRGWEDAFLTGDDLDEFLRAEEQTTRDVLTEIGLVE